MMIDAVIWDMDGTLLDTERLGQFSWYNLTLASGIECKLEQFQAFMARVPKDCAEIAEKEWAWPEGLYWKLKEKRDSAVREWIRHYGVQLIPGAKELVRYFSNEKIPQAVATASDQNITKQALASAGLLGMFQELVCGDEIERGKPDPECFLKAARKLGCSPSNTLVFEDAAPGIRAAHAGGFIPILIPHLAQPDGVKHLARMIFPSFDEALKWVAGEMTSPQILDSD